MTVHTIKNVTVAGSGVLGAQIAFQTAYHGFSVVVYDLSDDILEKAQTRLQSLQHKYIADLGASQAQVQEAYSRVAYSSKLDEAVRNADLVI